MHKPDQHKLQQYLNQPLTDLEEELTLYAPAERGPAEIWARIAAPLRQRICQEWDWCTRRQDARFENDVDLATAVLAILTTRVLILPIPVDLYLISAILVKRGLDQFCSCP